jgi:hydroxymethylglutaryl-CoA lyase
MAGSDEVLRRVRKPPACACRCWFPTARATSALAAGAREIAVFTAASEASAAEHERLDRRDLRALRGLVPGARREGLRVRGYVSTAFGCPYQGRSVRPARSGRGAAGRGRLPRVSIEYDRGRRAHAGGELLDD